MFVFLHITWEACQLTVPIAVLTAKGKGNNVINRALLFCDTLFASWIAQLTYPTVTGIQDCIINFFDKCIFSACSSRENGIPHLIRMCFSPSFIYLKSMLTIIRIQVSLTKNARLSISCQILASFRKFTDGLCLPAVCTLPQDTVINRGDFSIVVLVTDAFYAFGVTFLHTWFTRLSVSVYATSILWKLTKQLCFSTGFTLYWLYERFRWQRHIFLLYTQASMALSMPSVATLLAWLFISIERAIILTKVFKRLCLRTLSAQDWLCQINYDRVSFLPFFTNALTTVFHPLGYHIPMFLTIRELSRIFTHLTSAFIRRELFNRLGDITASAYNRGGCGISALARHTDNLSSRRFMGRWRQSRLPDVVALRPHPSMRPSPTVPIVSWMLLRHNPYLMDLRVCVTSH